MKNDITKIESNKTPEKCLIHKITAQHLANTQPFPEQWLSLPCLCPEYDVLWCGASLWPVQVSWSSLPSSCAPPGWQRMGNRKVLRLSTAQHRLKHHLVINIMIILHPKHSIVPVARKKITFIPVEMRTVNYFLPFKLLNMLRQHSSHPVP